MKDIHKAIIGIIACVIFISFLATMQKINTGCWIWEIESGFNETFELDLTCEQMRDRILLKIRMSEPKVNYYEMCGEKRVSNFVDEYYNIRQEYENRCLVSHKTRKVK